MYCSSKCRIFLALIAFHKGLASLDTNCCFGAVSGTVPEEPVVNKSTGSVYEKRLIEKYIQASFLFALIRFTPACQQQVGCCIAFNP